MKFTIEIVLEKQYKSTENTPKYKQFNLNEDSLNKRC